MKKLICILIILLAIPSCSTNKSSETSKDSISSPTQLNTLYKVETSNTPYYPKETQVILSSDAMVPYEMQNVVFDAIKNEDMLPKEIIFADINNDGMPERIVFSKLDDQNCSISVYNKENILLDRNTMVGKYGYELENIYTKDVSGDSVDDILIPSVKTAYTFNNNKLTYIEYPPECSYKSSVSITTDFSGTGDYGDVAYLSQQKNFMENKNSTILSVKSNKTGKKYSIVLKESFLDRNINYPVLSLVRFGDDNKNYIQIDNSLIYSFDESNGSEPIYPIASTINSNIEDLVCMEVDRNKVVLWPKNDPSQKTAIDISGDVACCISSDIELDKIHLVDSEKAYCVDYNNDGKNELCKTYYLKMPFQVLFNLEGPPEFNYGDIAKVEVYYSYKDGMWTYIDTKIIPKYKNPLREMERYNFFEKMEGSSGELCFKSNQKPAQTFNTQTYHSGLSIYYNGIRDLEKFSLTSPYFLMSNGLHVGESRKEVLEELGIPDGGFNEDNVFIYYFGSPPGCYVLEVDFKDDIVSKISLDSWLIYD